MTSNSFPGTAAWKARFSGWTDIERLQRHENKVLLVLTLALGAVVGLVVVAFILVTERLGTRFFPAEGAAWRRLVVPVAGALVTGVLLQRYFPAARGSGIPDTKTALLLRDGAIQFRTVVGKFLCSSVALASGIALGREGPAVQVGGGIASALGRRLGLGARNIRALVPVGCAAALAAAFNTPIAAVLFTLEEVIGDLHAPVLGSIVLSSATSWAMLHLLLGDEPLFHVPAYQLVHPIEFANYAILGLVGGLVSVAFVKLLLGLRRLFSTMPAWTGALRPAVGGLAVGTMALAVPGVLGVGYDHVGEALNGQLLAGSMTVLLVLKIVATATCYASGNSGGIFGPSLFIGAMLGGATGSVGHALLPDYTGSPGAYALIGMGTAFAGIIRAPMTSAIMIFEITRDYSIIVPVMIANLLSFFVSQRLQRAPIYEALLEQDGIVLPPGRALTRTPTVAQALGEPVPVLSADERVTPDLMRRSEEHDADTVLALERAQAAWPVVDARRRLLGMVTRAQLARALEEGRKVSTLADLVEAPGTGKPLTAATFPHVHLDHPLDTVLWRMTASGLNVLPVVSRTDIRDLVGTISIGDIMNVHATSGTEGDATVESRRERMSARALLATVAVTVLALVAIAGFLGHYYQLQRESTAKRAFEEGTALARQGRHAEAIQQLRNALSLTPSRGHRLTLGLELAAADQPNEASIYLSEVLSEDPRNAPAHLAMARIAARQGRADAAVQEYRQGIAGTWPESAVERQTEAHIELIDFLWKTGAREQATSEALQLSSRPSLTADTRRQLARRLLDFGVPARSAELFRQVLETAPDDVDAYAGLGEAEFALAHYEPAEAAYRSANRLSPEDDVIRARLELSQRILAIDPTIDTLTGSERYARSRVVLEGALAAFEQCAEVPDDRDAGPTSTLVASARRALSVRRRSPLLKATTVNLQLTRQLWERSDAACRRRSQDEALARVLDGLPVS